MTKKLALSLALFTLSPLSCLLVGAAKEPAKDAAAPLKMPAVTVDASPVGEGLKPGVVASYADVVEPAQKFVVSVYSTKTVKTPANVPPMLRQFFNEVPEAEQKQKGMGSGVIVSADGYILTNNHVVEGADELKVSLFDDRELVAKVIGSDPKTDVAVIKIDAAALPFATLADSDKLRVGDIVFAIGNPLEVGLTVTMGIVSAVGRSNLELLEDRGGYENFIQTDAAINMGNSGGALIDARGRLVGINTAILSPSRGNIGIGFAIPTNIAASIMQSLIENNGVVHRGMLGISGRDLSSDLAEAMDLKKEQKGVLVADLFPEGGPAEKAGIKREDVVVGINGKVIASLQDLRFTVSQLRPGAIAQVKVLRAGKELTFDVTLGALDEEENSNELFEGVKATPLTPELRKQLGIRRPIEGLVVQEIEENSPYAGRLVPNLIVLEINRRPVATVAEARKALKKGHNLLYVIYAGNRSYLTIYIQ